jgi:ABC-type transporter Mla subunit MlaD
MDAANFGGAQLGDVSQGDVAQTITNITNNLGDVITILRNDLVNLEGRVDTLEKAERQHTTERQAMTRLITMLASESRTVSDVQELLERQIEGDRAERAQRRRYLDTMLSALVGLALVNFAFNLIRVLRRSGRAAKP